MHNNFYFEAMQHQSNSSQQVHPLPLSLAQLEYKPPFMSAIGSTRAARGNQDKKGLFYLHRLQDKTVQGKMLLQK